MATIRKSIEGTLNIKPQMESQSAAASQAV